MIDGMDLPVHFTVVLIEWKSFKEMVIPTFHYAIYRLKHMKLDMSSLNCHVNEVPRYLPTLACLGREVP